MGKELSKRGLDGDALKNVGRGILFLAIVVLHVWFSRIASPLSWITPIPCAAIFTAATYGLSDITKPWSKSTDQEGVTARNGSRWIMLLMTIALYVIGFIDRG
jgi:hypothetical protein